MKVARTIVRLLFGLAWIVFGLNGFLDFMPKPVEEAPPQRAVDFFNGLVGSGYMMQLISGTQLLAGILITSGFFVPLGLTILAPILVNIVAFHLFANPVGIEPGLIAVAIELFLVFAYRKAFTGVLSPRYSDEVTGSAPPPARSGSGPS